LDFLPTFVYNTWLSSNLTIFEIRIDLMPAIRLKENEPFEVAIRRFKRTVEKTGLLTELRAREFYEKPTAERSANWLLQSSATTSACAARRCRPSFTSIGSQIAKQPPV